MSVHKKCISPGIIEHVGRIASLERNGEGGRLRVDAGPPGRRPGHFRQHRRERLLPHRGRDQWRHICRRPFRRDATLHLVRERASQARVVWSDRSPPGKELGGHFVQGHVDGVGRVARLAQEGPNWWLAVRLPPALERYAATKGSIAIDGISLTVSSLRDGIVEAAIIPFTYANTNLQSLVPGSAVNLEADILAKYR